MGRKGIGKLSLFSIADTIEISILQKRRSRRVYDVPPRHPECHSKPRRPRQGTRHRPWTMANLLSRRAHVSNSETFGKKITGVEGHLRRRLARRFSVIGATHYFRVLVNGAEITVSDRDYYPKLQFVWYYGDYGRQCRTHLYQHGRNMAAHGDI